MIVRGYVACLECGHPHIVRIGMGQEAEERHNFACRSCHESIEVGLNVDYKNVSFDLFYGSNCKAIDPTTDGSIVNLDANFLIPDDQQGKEYAFPRLFQGAAMVQNNIAARRAKGLSDFPDETATSSARRPFFSAEWKDCRAAWSLWRNGKTHLVEKRVEAATSTIYPDDPLSDLPDWLWRFAMKLAGTKFDELFQHAIKELNSASNTEDFGRFCELYDHEISKIHGRLYFELVKSYFESYDDFGQIQFLIANGVEVPNGKAASVNFDSIKMFYGGAFEAFSSLVELFAYINNLNCGRKFDQFENLTRDQYLKLDKAGRFKAFEGVPAFTDICLEADNTLRNASHHNGFDFDPKTQAITYRSGKGGQGNEQSIGYTEYLSRCVQIFMQVMVVFRIELIFANRAHIRPPL